MRDDPRLVARPRTAFCGNRLLDSLDGETRMALDPHLERVTLSRKQVLFEPGEVVELVHFPCPGLVVSMTAEMADGRVAEVGLIGCEGAVGGIISGGSKPAFTRATVQLAGVAIRIEAARLDALRAVQPRLDEALVSYADLLLAQSMQSTACSALHPVERRACRFLLMLHDRVTGSELAVTQEFLAEMLGVQRTTVTRVLAGLAEAGIVARRRGRVRVANRPALERASCECYAVVNQHVLRIAPRLLTRRTC